MGLRPPPPHPFCPGFFSFVNVCRMFNMESRHLLNSSVQNAPDCISENFNLKNLPGGACAYPGCQRLLSHARKTSGTHGSMRPKLLTKVHRSHSWWALSRPYCHCILFLWAPSITKPSVRPCEVFLFRIKSDCYLIARSLSRILYFRQVLTLVDSFDCLGP